MVLLVFIIFSAVAVAVAQHLFDQKLPLIIDPSKHMGY